VNDAGFRHVASALATNNVVKDYGVAEVSVMAIQIGAAATAFFLTDSDDMVGQICRFYLVTLQAILGLVLFSYEVQQFRLSQFAI
jgi:hypothetical protein